MSSKILVIEDEARMRRLLDLVLQEAGYEVKTASDGIEGIATWKQWRPDLVLSDLKMPRMDGLDVLRFRNQNFPEVPFILLTAFGSVETAVSAMKGGAFDYLTKPVDNNEVLILVDKALSAASPLGCSDTLIVGSSAAIHQLHKEIVFVSKTDSSVIITGETGTGKELVAKAIHKAFGGDDSPFVRVNCPAIPENLLESELFGHRRGAFTGAVQDRKGAFVTADRGVLFLDEIGDMPLPLQAKLLHAVEQKQITPVGGSKGIGVAVKIVAATNCELEEMVAQGSFRRDLYYRINTLQVRLPPLRERREDIQELACYFLSQFCRQYGKKDMSLEKTAIERLQEYHWPGNIRELRNVIERGFLQCQGEVFTADLLTGFVGDEETYVPTPFAPDGSLDLATQERSLIVQALENSFWNQSKAAEQLGITRNTLRYRMKKYNIHKG